jgi:hypothetical protein
MILSLQQVKEKLGIGDTRLHQLIDSGILPTVNQRKPETKKFFRRFDSAVVNKVAAELKYTNGHSKKYLTSQPEPEVDFTELVKQRSWKPTPEPKPKPQAQPEPKLGEGILSRLKAIEDKLDLLIKTWS